MAKIFCFSSTGNSLYVAKRISERIGGEAVSMSHGAVSCADDVIGIVFPVYFWGLPKTADEFISKLEITSENPYIFIVATCGGSAQGVQGRVKKMFEKKRFVPQYYKNLLCVGNYIIKFDIDNSPEKQAAIEDGIEEIAADILARRTNSAERATMLSKIVYRLYPAHNKKCDSAFTVSDACTACGICGQICPNGNIRIKDKTVEYLHRCELCLACIHACPAKAIEYADKTQLHKRYINPNIKLGELVEFCGKGEYIV
jgi:Fe-S-cluster-containing hydrogenase components 2